MPLFPGQGTYTYPFKLGLITANHDYPTNSPVNIWIIFWVSLSIASSYWGSEPRSKSNHWSCFRPENFWFSKWADYCLLLVDALSLKHLFLLLLRKNIIVFTITLVIYLKGYEISLQTSNGLRCPWNVILC